MIEEAAVIAILAKVARKPQDTVQPNLSLASLGLSSSFGLSAVRSLIEAAGSGKLPPLGMRMTVAEVVALATGTAPAPSTTPPAAPRASSPAVGSNAAPIALDRMGLGMDLQALDVFPVVDDYRADAFYTGHFHPSEIATAILRADPRVHLCGIFCAKEAAKKSHPALLDRRMTDFEIVHDESGRPGLRLADDDSAFSFLLSITHSGAFAAATCLTFER